MINIVFFLILALIVLAFTILDLVLIVYVIYAAVAFAQATKILGLRVAKNHDLYQEKGEEQFKRECYKHNISTSSRKRPNLCYLIPVLSMKGLHLEFVKDGNEEYNHREGNYLGSEEWIEKWRKIIFSPTITSSEFCSCIKLIMQAHHFKESNNNVLPYAKGLDGMIREEDSFFIFRALYIMHYNIRIRENKNEIIEYMVSSSSVLRERNKKETHFAYHERNVYNTKKLADIVDIHKGYNSIDNSEITLEKSHKGLIFPDDIANGKSSMSYDGNTCFNFEQCVHSGYIVMNQSAPFIINKWKEDDCILTENILGFEIKNEDIICDYLLLYLNLLIEEIKMLKINKTKLELRELENCIIPIPPRSEQKDIIERSRFYTCKNEKIKALLESANTLFMNTINDNISKMQKTAKQMSMANYLWY